jgi:mannose-1-phosphate guanylyltransferase
MAGGSGTRFWPLSREKMPKQLLKIGAEDTLIQETVKRVLPLIKREDIFVVTNHSLMDAINMQLSAKFGETWEMNFILEPEARNTAPALGLAALHLNRIDPDGIMVVFSADHSIRKADEFLSLLRKAEKAALDNYLVTLGIKPDRPETGYGYIKAGDPCYGSGDKDKVSDDAGVCKVEAFVEAEH